jgi:DNA/RNA-binding domain of Phe-tRNA-synthetase-like protein
VSEPEVVVSQELKDSGVYVYYALVPSLRVTPTPAGLDRELRDAEEEVRVSIGTPERLTDHPVVRAYRSLLWRLGVDPTKVRPSGEALARRVLRGASLPRINSVVDAGNLVSLRTLVPIGLYDAERLSFPLTLKRASGSEDFRPIGGKPVKVRKGYPILVDASGRVLHIYPHRDSEDTMIRDTTKSVLVMAAGAPGVPRDLVRRALTEVIELLAKYSSAQTSGVGVREA